MICRYAKAPLETAGLFCIRSFEWSAENDRFDPLLTILWDEPKVGFDGKPDMHAKAIGVCCRGILAQNNQVKEIGR